MDLKFQSDDSIVLILLAMMAKSYELADSTAMVVIMALVVGCYAGDLACELAIE